MNHSPSRQADDKTSEPDGDRVSGGDLMARRTPPPGRVWCSAMSKSSGAPCHYYAIPGGTVCRFHGGAAKQVQRAAAKVLEERRVTALLERADMDPGQDPVEVLQAVVDRAGAIMTILEGELADQQLDRLSSERGEILVRMLGEAMDRAGKWSTAKAGLSLDERKVKVSEVTASQLVSLVEVCGRQVGIPPAQIGQLTKAIGAEARRRRDTR